MINSLLSYAPVKIFSALIIFILIAIQARFLSVDDYGYFAIYMLIMELVRAASSQWISVSVIRLYPAKSKSEQSDLLSISFKLILFCFLIAIIIIPLVLYFYGGCRLSTFLTLSLFLFSKTIFLYYLDLSRLEGKPKRFRYAVLSQSITSVALTILFLDHAPEVEFAFLALAISYLLGSIYIFILPVKSHTSKNDSFLILSYGMPLLISGVLSVLVSRVDRLFIAEQLGMFEAGMYSALSNMLLGVMSLVFVVVSMPLYPSLTKHVDRPVVLKKLHSEYLDLLLLVTFPAIIGVCFSAEPLILLILGEQYLEGGLEVFWMLAISSYLFNIKAHYFDHALQFTLNTKYMPLTPISGVLVNVVGLLMLLEPLGLYGASFSLILANVASIMLSIFLGWRCGYSFTTGPSFVKILVSASLLAISLALCTRWVHDYSPAIQLFLLVSAGLLVYVPINFAFNTCDLRKKLTIGLGRK